MWQDLSAQVRERILAVLMAHRHRLKLKTLAKYREALVRRASL
jgi:hypothetical protein